MSEEEIRGEYEKARQDVLQSAMAHTLNCLTQKRRKSVAERRMIDAVERFCKMQIKMRIMEFREEVAG